MFVYIFITLLTNSMISTKPMDLSSITWAHAVNNKDFLDETLKGEIQMIEADVSMGTLENTNEEIAIMAHPPFTASDLSLIQFVSRVDHHNKSNRKKGIKLDFKSITAFETAIRDNIFVKFIKNADYPVWLNADILEGPLADPRQIPVDPGRFFQGVKLFPDCVLSLGWTTGFERSEKARYTEGNVSEMLKLIEDNRINHRITFAVRAGLVAESSDQMLRLVKKNTLTLWSGKQDEGFDVDKLNNVLRVIGPGKVYIDVPEDLRKLLV